MEIAQPGILRVIVSQTGLISESVQRPDLFSINAAKRKPDEIIFLVIRHVLWLLPEMRPLMRTKWELSEIISHMEMIYVMRSNHDAFRDMRCFKGIIHCMFLKHTKVTYEMFHTFRM